MIGGALADNCSVFTDCFGVSNSAAEGAFGLSLLATLSLVLDFVPFVGGAKGLIEAATGRDLLTGEKLEPWERALGVLAVVPFGQLGKLGKVASHADELADLGRHADDLADLGRHGDDLADLGRHSDDVLDAAGDAGRGPGWSGLDDVPSGGGASPPKGPHPLVGEPVDVATGAVVVQVVDAAFPGLLPLELTRGLASTVQAGGSFGTAWCSLLDERLELQGTTARYVTASAAVHVFDLSTAGPDGWVHTSRGRALALHRDSAVEWTAHELTTGRSWRFTARADRPDVAPLTLTWSRDGHRIDLERHPDGAVRRVVHGGGYTVDVIWTAVAGAGPRVAGYTLATPSGPVPLTTFGYHQAGSEVGQLAWAADSRGRGTRYGYDAAGRLAWFVDSNGTRYAYDYDLQGRCVRGRGTDGVLDVRIGYGDRTREVTDAVGALTRYEVNELGQVIRMVDPLGRVSTAEWDAHDRPLRLTDAAGGVRRFAWSPAGDPVELVDEAGRVTRVEWAGPGRPAAVQAPDGALWQTRYDAGGRPAQLVDPAGAVTTLAHDPRGALVATTDAAGVTTRYEVDAAGLPVAVVDGTGARTVIERDPFGRVVAVRDPLGGVTRQEWTVEGRPARRTDPDGATQTWEWDGEGNLLRHTDADGRATAFEYTPFDVPRSRTTADGARTELRYDAVQRLVAVVDPLGRSWSWARDAAGQVVGETDVNGRTLTYTRDVAGRITRRVNASGQQVGYRYDPTGLLLAIEGPDGDPAATTAFRYDAAGRLAGTTGAGVDHVVDRDATGRVVAESWNGQRVGHTYDGAGRRVRRVTPSGIESLWSYDVRGLASGLDVAGQRVGLDRDPLGREIARLLGGARIEQEWTASSRLAAARVLVSDGIGTGIGLLDERRYDWSAAGELLGTVTATDGAAEQERFTLDPVGRVLAHAVGGQEVARFGYDAAGTLTGSGTPDAGGQPWETAGTLVTRAGATTYTYDRDGRLAMRRTTRPSLTAAVERFTYDALDRLVSVHLADGTAWTYRYDGLGRRVLRVHTDPTGTVLRSETAVWDGDLLAETTRYDAPAAGQPDVPTTTLTWDHHPDTGYPLTQLRSRGALAGGRDQAWYDREFHAIVTDLAGAPRHLVTPAGALVPAQRRSLWGRRLDAAEALCPLGFAGQVLDPETGLLYTRHRYYDPDTASFTTPDPLGVAPGTNPHLYVPNPTTWIDPLGLTPCGQGGGSGGGSSGGSSGGVPGGQSPPEVLRLTTQESWANPNTLADHFARHGGDFGAVSADDYAAQASAFFQRSQIDHLPTKIGSDGTIRVYDAASNTFGSFTPAGQTKTFFKPTSATYWDRQPGVAPWTP